MTVPVRFSNLRAMAKSPAHYLSAVTVPRKDSTAMALGRATHSIVLEDDAGLVVYEGERRGKAWTEFRDAQAEGVEIVTSTEYERANAIAAAVLADPVAAPLLRGPEVQNEKRVTWTMDGLDCALRYDALGPTWLADLKTTGDASPAHYRRHAEKLFVPSQLNWYRNALRSLGCTIDNCYIVAVETEPPYAVTVLHVSEPMLEEGGRIWRGWWETLKNCEATGVWPGYAAGAVEWETYRQEEDPMTELDFTTTPPQQSAAERYMELRSEMQRLGDALKVERMELLEKLRRVEGVLAEVAPQAKRRPRSVRSKATSKQVAA